MKILLCLVITLVVVQAIVTGDEKNIDDIHKCCQKQSGVSQELIDRARRKDLVDDPKLKTYILCLAKKKGLCNDKGEFDINAVKTKLKNKKISDDRINKIIEKCIVKKKKPEDSAFEFSKCLAKN